MKSVARIKGMVKAVADQVHPLQTTLKLILTDFEPNENGQGVPREEAANIIKYAENMPLKINFDGDEYHGHTGAMAVGPIVNVHEATIDSRDVITADGIVWNEIYTDISDYLKEKFPAGIGTSWEIYYENSELKNGVEWLKGCVFAGTCIVDTPAYGPERTRVLAIAEKLKKRQEASNLEKEITNVTPEQVIEQNTEQENTSPQDTTENTEEVKEEVAIADVVADTNVAGEPTEFDVARDSINQAQSVLFDLYDGLNALYNQTFAMEQEKKAASLDDIAGTFAKMLEDLTARFNDLSAAKSEFEQVKAETARAQKVTNRRLQFIEAGLDEVQWSEREDMYMRLDDDMFVQYITDLVTVSNKPARAEKTSIKIPEPVHSNKELTNKDLVVALREELKIHSRD